MPADAVSGLAEAIAALIQVLVEGIVLTAQLVAELVFLLIRLFLWLSGKQRQLSRPGWMARRDETTTRRARTVILAALVAAAAGSLAFHHWGFTRIDFTSDRFNHPDGVGVALVRDGEVRGVAVPEDRLKILRGRWDRIEIRDPRYVPATYPIEGRLMVLRLEAVPSLRADLTESVTGKVLGLLKEKLGDDSTPASPPR